MKDKYGCVTCPHNVGDAYQRDCAYPDCMDSAVIPPGWSITYNPKPIPDSRFEYDYVHEDYDGAPDGNDNRCGNAASKGAAIIEIMDIISMGGE